MPESSPTTTLNDPIPGSRAEELFSALQHHKSRLIIKEVVQEYVDSSAFAEKVEHIQLRSLEADPARNKLKDWVIGVVKEYLAEQGLKRRNFIWPLAISIISAAGTIAAVVVAIIALQQN